MAREKEKKPRDVRAGVALLWGERELPTRGPKPSLSAARIAASAVDLADDEGLDAVSMNKIAAEFGVSAMALYRYVPGKAELVELMVEAVLEDVPDVGSAPDWRSGLTVWAHRSLEVYRVHPWLLAATAMRRQIMGPCQLAWLDAALGVLEPTGLAAREQHEVFLLVVGHVRGVAQQILDRDEDHDRQWNELTGELLARHADRFPSLTRVLASGGFAAGPPDAASLDFGLARILDGVQALIDHESGPRKR